MTGQYCDLPQRTHIEFMESGIKVIPFSTTQKSDTRNYDYARLKISREAGEVINENSKVPERVRIYATDRILADLYLPENGLTLDDDKAFLELLDPRAILQRGNVDKVFSAVSLEEIIDWFESEIHRQVGENVIDQVYLVNSSDVDPTEITSSYYEASENIDNDLISETVDFLTYNGMIERLVDDENLPNKDEVGGFDFEQDTLAEVLAKIEDRFELTSRVNQYGTLRIGTLSDTPNQYFGGVGRNTWSIQDYNITINPNKVSQVYAKGGYKQAKQKTNKETVTPQNKYDGKLRMIGYATTNKDQIVGPEFPTNSDQMEGNVIRIEPSDTTDGKTLEKIAERRLRKEIGRNVSGNITVNPIHSPTKYGWPHDIKPGDVFGIFPPSNNICDHFNVPETSFRVTQVTHEINPRKGWELNLTLSQLPQSEIYTASFEMAPMEQMFQSSEELYGETNDYWKRFSEPADDENLLEDVKSAANQVDDEIKEFKESVSEGINDLF